MASLRPETVHIEGEWEDTMRPCTDVEWLERLQAQVDGTGRHGLHGHARIKKLELDVTRIGDRLQDALETIVNMKRAIKLQNAMIARIIEECPSTASRKSSAKSSKRSAKATPSAPRRARKA